MYGRHCRDESTALTHPDGEVSKRHPRLWSLSRDAIGTRMQAAGNRKSHPSLHSCGGFVFKASKQTRGSKHRFLHTKGAGRRWEAELLRQPDTMKRVDAEPVDIKLIPCEAVSDAAWIGMVVVVPALAKRQ